MVPSMAAPWLPIGKIQVFQRPRLARATTLASGYGVFHLISPGNEQPYPLVIHRFSTAHPQPYLPAINSAKQRPVVAQDHPRGVVAGGAGDAAAGMGAGAAMVEAFEGPAVIGVAQHRPR
jgi:hypothetical protein